jgi:bifunctional non-homologous end joining protein LigD
MKIKRLPAGFVIPAQPVLASRPPSGPGWVHEIKHDGYRLIVRRDGPPVRLYSRNAYDWTVRLAAIAAAARRIKARSFTIDGEAVVLGPDGLSRFEELRRREASDTAILYAFDLVEHDGEDMRNRPFLDRKGALARLLRNTEAGILFNEHIAGDGPVVFAHACRLGAEALCRRRSTAPIDPARAAFGSRCAILPALPCSGSGARCGTDGPEAARARCGPATLNEDKGLAQLTGARAGHTTGLSAEVALGDAVKARGSAAPIEA